MIQYPGIRVKCSRYVLFSPRRRPEQNSHNIGMISDPWFELVLESHVSYVPQPPEKHHFIDGVNVIWFTTTTQYKLQMCSCASVNAWLVEENPTSCSGQWQHDKSCVHISKCASWCKKNTTSASCKWCPLRCKWGANWRQDKHHPIASCRRSRPSD